MKKKTMSTMMSSASFRLDEEFVETHVKSMRIGVSLLVMLSVKFLNFVCLMLGNSIDQNYFPEEHLYGVL